MRRVIVRSEPSAQSDSGQRPGTKSASLDADSPQKMCRSAENRYCISTKRTSLDGSSKSRPSSAAAKSCLKYTEIVQTQEMGSHY